MRSISGPEMSVAVARDLLCRAMAAAAWIARHNRRDRDSLRQPIEICAGNSQLRFSRDTTTTPLSSGSRNASSALRGNSGSSSRNNTPRCASDSSPGLQCSAADQRGHRGRVLRAAKRPAAAEAGSAARGRFQARDFQDSCADKGGSKPGNRCASKVLPAPGGPIISSPCSPAAAISKARLAAYWPRTSARSGPRVAMRDGCAAKLCCAGARAKCGFASERVA